MSQVKVIVCPECALPSEFPQSEIQKFIKCPHCQKLVKPQIRETVQRRRREDKEPNAYQVKIQKLEAKLQKAEQIRKQNLAYQKEVVKLKKELGTIIDSSSTSIEGLETLTLRIDHEKKVIYANTPFCTHFSINKESIIGREYSILRRVMDNSLFDAIVWHQNAQAVSKTVTDNKNNHFEIKVTATDGGIDVIFQDVTNEQRFKKYVQRYVSMDLTNLSDEDLVTFKYPERRFMTVSFTDLRDFTALSETMKPEEVRSTMNAYLEDIIHAINSNEATVDKIVGDEVMALFGAPRYYEDHALRAIKTACDQMTNLKALQASFARFGKHMPDCGIGINSGEMVVGNMGCTARQDYTVLGSSVNLAARLCGAARRGEIIITESTLNSALSNLPSDWEINEATLTQSQDQHEIRGKTEGILPLPDRLKDRVVYIGPGIKENPDQWEYRFTFQFSIKVKGIKTPLPIISVINRNKRSSLVLDSTKVTKTKNERFFGKFRLIERVGRGGMGEVWKAKDNFGNIVALKMLIAGDGASNKQLKRFKREAEIMAKLQHRNICRIYEVGMIEQKSYISMEYIDGVTLSQVLKYQGNFVSGRHNTTGKAGENFLHKVIDEVQIERKSRKTRKTKVKQDKDRKYFILPIEHTLGMIVKCLDAIQYAHEHAILHRDIKPANIMIRPNGEPVLMDFGLAKMDTDTTEGMSLSISGQIVGTIEYMAPEQAQSSKMSSEISDIYSMGAVMYQMLAGKRHFNSSGNILTDSNALQDHIPPKISQFNKKVDRALETITMKSLRPDPDERYQDVDSFMTDLIRYQSGLDIAAKNVSMVQVISRLLQRNRLATSITLVAISLFIVGFIAALLRLYIKGDQVESLKYDLKSSQNDYSDLEGEMEKLTIKTGKFEQEKKASEKARYEAMVEMNKIKKQKTELENEKESIDKQLSNAEQEIGELIDKIEHYKNASTTFVHLNKANEYIQAYNFIKAEEQVDAALKLSPEDPNGILTKSLLLIKKENFEDALSLLKENTKKIKSSKALVRLKFLLNNIVKDPELFSNLNKSTDQLDKGAFKEVVEFKNELSNTFMELGADFFVEQKYLNPEKRKSLWEYRIETGIGKGAVLSQSDSNKWNLDLTKTKVSTLSPLKGIKLHSLQLNKADCSDFIVLKGTNVKNLQLSNSKTNYWSWMRELNLNSLNLTNSNFNDLKVVAHMKNLKNLNLSKTKIKNIKILNEIPQLYNLNLSGTDFDLSQLSELKLPNLKKLHLSNTHMHDLNFLASLSNIRELYLNDCKNLHSLSGIENLKINRLEINGAGLSDLSQLGNIPLKTLRISKVSNYKNLGALKKIPSLSKISTDHAGGEWVSAKQFLQDNP